MALSKISFKRYFYPRSPVSCLVRLWQCLRPGDAFGDAFIGDAFGDAFGESFSDAFIGDTFIGDAFIGDTFIGDAFIGDAFIGDSFIGDAFVGDAFVGDNFIGDAFIGDTLAVGFAVPGSPFGCMLMRREKCSERCKYFWQKEFSLGRRKLRIALTLLVHSQRVAFLCTMLFTVCTV